MPARCLSMDFLRLTLAAACAWWPALVQPSEPLPTSLSGRWTLVPSGGRTINESWSVRFEGSRAAGAIKGKVTWRGRGCGAQDQPFDGSWDGTELKFRFIARPNENVQVLNATTCGEGTTDVVLRRKPSGASFDGQANFNNGAAILDVTASP